jgi:CNT family concentrative nucleoside transporter
MQYIVIKMAWFMMRLMDTSGSESVVAAASPFVGQGESALLVKPFVEYMTKSELHSTMTSGFATIAGSVLLAYIGFLDDASSLLCSCVMSIPASLLLSKMRYPEREESITKGEVKIPQTEEKEANFLHAAGNGSGTGIHLVLLICAALLAIVTLFTVCDQFVGWAFGMIEVYDFVNGPNPDGSMKPISIQLCLSYFFYPFAWLIGMPASDARKAGEIMAVKMVVNEFLAYSQLAELSKKHLLQPRSMLLY